MRNRKIRELRLQKLENQAKLYETRLSILECEHDGRPDTETRHMRITNSGGCTFEEYCPWTAFVMKCAKCGKVLRDLTEIEYLKARLEEDEGSFLGRSNEMKERLAELEAEGADS